MEKEDIYFAASIRGGRDDVLIYKRLISYLGKYGNVLTVHIGDQNIKLKGEDDLDDTRIYDRDMNWLNISKRLVAEVTTSSLGVGYELGRIVERNHWINLLQLNNLLGKVQESLPEYFTRSREILALYRPSIDKKLSAMIAGCPGIINIQYTNVEEAERVIDRWFKN